MKSLYTAVILGSALLSACVTAPAPGTQEGVTPPRLSTQGTMTVWDNVGSFGPVPSARADLGAQTCSKLDTMGTKFMASGYHSRAQGLDGKTLAEGGFYCVPK